MTGTTFGDSFAPIAIATRSGAEESIHHGAGSALAADGTQIASIGDPDVVVFPRSALKPMQADAMVGLGLDLPSRLLAVACASHSGEAVHLDAVREILHRFDFTEAELQNTADRPYGAAARTAARLAGVEPSPLQQNCSGKHAAMLATCRINGWSTDEYLHEDHPLQVAITRRIDELVTGADDGSVAHVGIDGCGAPSHMIFLRGLAQAYARLANSQSAVAAAMAAHPHLVGGTGRDITAWTAVIPGLVVKEGAAGVLAAAMPDGRAVAFKIADGSDLARRAVTVTALRHLGLDDGNAAWDATARAVAVPVLGHGVAVGELRGLDWTRPTSRRARRRT